MLCVFSVIVAQVVGQRKVCWSYCHRAIPNVATHCTQTASYAILDYA